MTYDREAKMLSNIRLTKFKTKNKMVSIYEVVEKAKKTGKIEKGINEVTKAIERSTAKLVVYAKDVSPAEIIQHLPVLCKEKKIVCEEVDSKEKLGIAVGIKVACSAVAIIDAGEAVLPKAK